MVVNRSMELEMRSNGGGRYSDTSIAIRWSGFVPPFGRESGKREWGK